MLISDFLSLHILLPALGLTIASVMAIDGLVLAKMKLWRFWVYVVFCFAALALTLWDGAREDRESREQSVVRAVIEKKRDDADKQHDANLKLSLANEEKLKHDVEELARAQIQRGTDLQHAKPIPRKEPAPTSPPPSDAASLAHVSFTQEQVTSTDPKLPYALRVILQTDKSIHNPDFLLLCEGKVKGGTFFVVGQGVMMQMRSGPVINGCGFRLSFNFPDFTPDAPISVMLLSDELVKVTEVRDTRAVPWN